MAHLPKEMLQLIGHDLLKEIGATNKIFMWQVLQFDISVCKKINRIVMAHDVYRDDYEIVFQRFCARTLTITEINRIKRINFVGALPKTIREVIDFHNNHGNDAVLEVVYNWDRFEIRKKEG